MVLKFIFKIIFDLKLLILILLGKNQNQ